MAIDLQSLTPPPFNPEVLKFARAKFRHSIDDLVDYSKIAKSSLEKIEAGRKVPTSKQLSILANLYSLEGHEFFDDIIPELTTTPKDFRDGGKVGPALLSIINQTNTTSSKLLKIVSVLDKPNPRINELCASSIKELTSSGYISAVKKELKIKSNDFLKLNHAGKRPLSSFLLRYRIEALGASLSFTSFPLNEATGVLTASNAIPTILVNTAKHKNSYEFTIAHELAHLLLKKPGISDTSLEANNKIERACNNFAKVILAPRRIVKASFARSSSVSNNINRLHKNTLLSKTASGYRLVEEKLISRSDFEGWLKVHTPKISQGGYNPENYHDIDGHIFAKLNKAGLLKTALVKGCLDRDYISHFEAEGILGYRTEYLDDVVFLIKRRRLDVSEILGDNYFSSSNATYIENF